MSIELRRIGLKGLLASVAIAGMTAGLATAQIAANESATVSQMETLLEGQGIDVTNLQVAAGTNQQYGSFSNGLGAVNIDSGVYISTGQGANFAQIATNQSDITNNGNTPDSDLTALRSTATNDTAALQMTVTPAANTIKARMVFASEEYPEYVCRTFNDAFGLFVSGPGVTGTMNFAQVPGSNTDISINTVNNGLNNDGQVCAGETSNNSNLYNDNPTGASFIFDGYTDAIEVTMYGVTPGEDYVFKMAVADAIDTIYDSAVFVDFLESVWEHTADLSLDLTASTQAPVIGQNFTITATIDNAGPDEVPFFKVADILPAGLTFVSASGDGTYDDTNDEWSSTASIAANGTMTMTLTANATAAGTYTTASEVIEQWSDDVDSTPNDGEGDDYDTLSVNVVQVDRSDTPVAGTSYGEVTHVLTTGIQLGTAIDADTLSIANADSSGDGADDDGVNFPALRPGDSTVIRVRVAQASGNSGYLQGWIDWNGDGSFGAGEQIAIDLQSATAGTSFIYLPVTVPATMTTNQTFARFRWSTTQGLDATTAADDGEVEDYAVTASAAAAPVFSPSCVAATVENGGFELPAIGPGRFTLQDETLVPGWSTDATNNIIERWGTWFNNIPSSVGSHHAELNATQVAALTQEIGVVEAGDTIEWSYWHRGRHGTDTMTFGVGVDGGAITVLQTATTGNKAWVNYTGSASVPLGNLRFEFRSVSSAGGSPSPSVGNFLDDFHFAICLVARDYSDAPLDGSTAPNGTGVTAYGVANHPLTNTSTLLGAAVDGDTPPIGNANATGDGGDDDGVTLPTLTQGLSATISVDVTQAGGNQGYLQGWIDWYGDGGFGGSGEQIASDVQDGGVGDTDGVANGTIVLSVTPPANGFTGTSYARFRWSTDTGLPSTGSATDGEVEDYAVIIRDLDELSFTPDQRRTVIPGTVVLYPHTLYVPEDLSGGTLAFAQTSDQSLNWTIWRDVDASGDLSAADVQWVNGAALPATGELGFIVQAQIAGTVPAGWRDISEFAATVTLGSQTRSSSVTDVTDVSGLDAGTLTAAKFLAIDTDCDGALTDESAGDAAFEIGKQGAPGTCVVYRITFRNDSTATVTEVVVRDMVPAWTSYVAGSANYETVPSGMTAGTATEPTAGQRGALAFPFTGSLAAGAGGAVSYEVKIDE